MTSNWMRAERELYGKRATREGFLYAMKWNHLPCFCNATIIFYILLWSFNFYWCPVWDQNLTPPLLFILLNSPCHSCDALHCPQAWHPVLQNRLRCCKSTTEFRGIHWMQKDLAQSRHRQDYGVSYLPYPKATEFERLHLKCMFLGGALKY